MSDRVERRKGKDARFASFCASNVTPHKAPGYAIVTISLKPIGGLPATPPPTRWTLSPISPRTIRTTRSASPTSRTSILPHVALDDLPAVYDRLASVGLSTPNAGLISDIIACPGLDYCALANARSIPIAQRIAERFGDGARARSIGPLKIKISGCINACGHHHVGHIGILGVEREGEETYQITLGGSGDETGGDRPDHRPRLQFGERRRRDRDRRRNLYRPEARRAPKISCDAYRRVGMAPFKEALYERSAGSDI